jgi:hypothetical protein
VPELSLHPPPVYRRFLTDGPDGLRLSWPAAVAVFGAGVFLLAIADGIPAFLGDGDR